MSANRVGFQYIVLRCVPRVDREEFVNVGVVLYSQAADFLCAASHVYPGRLLALSAEIDIESVRSALASIEAVCRGDANAGAAASTSLSQRFGWLAAPKSTVVQPGPVHGGVTDDPARQLEHLLDELVH
jgi:hypothetical protein